MPSGDLVPGQATGCTDLKQAEETEEGGCCPRTHRTAYRRDWIKESLVEKVTAYRAVYEQKEPYSDDEINQRCGYRMVNTSRDPVRTYSSWMVENDGRGVQKA